MRVRNLGIKTVHAQSGAHAYEELIKFTRFLARIKSAKRPNYWVL